MGNAQKSDALLTRKSIRQALKCWNSLLKLGEHPLANLGVVVVLCQALPTPISPVARGAVLRDVLQEAIESLRPRLGKPDYTQKRWRSYVILIDQYVQGVARADLADQLGLALDSYNHENRRALDELIIVLREWEQQPPEFPRRVEPTSSAIPLLIHDFAEQIEHLHQTKGRSGNGARAGVETLVGEELARAYEVSHACLVSASLNMRGETNFQQGAVLEAEAAFRKARETAEAIGSQEQVAIACFGLAKVALAQDDRARAYQWGMTSLATLEAISHTWTNDVRSWLDMLKQSPIRPPDLGSRT